MRSRGVCSTTVLQRSPLIVIEQSMDKKEKILQVELNIDDRQQARAIFQANFFSHFTFLWVNGKTLRTFIRAGY